MLDINFNSRSNFRVQRSISESLALIVFRYGELRQSVNVCSLRVFVPQSVCGKQQYLIPVVPVCTCLFVLPPTGYIVHVRCFGLNAVVSLVVLKPSTDILAAWFLFWPCSHIVLFSLRGRRYSGSVLECGSAPPVGAHHVFPDTCEDVEYGNHAARRGKSQIGRKYSAPVYQVAGFRLD